MKAIQKQQSSTRRLFTLLVGCFVYCIGVNMFIVPASLYSGGGLGLCQIVRTLLSDYLGIHFGAVDIAGILYYILNVPILIAAWINIDRWFVFRTLISVTTMTILLSIIPTVPLLPGDTITSCLLGGVISGLGVGIILRTGATLGGVDMISLMLLRKRPGLSVGHINLAVNLLAYGICMVLFDIPTAIYSIVYAAIYSIAVDYSYTQNIDVEVTIITKAPVAEMEQAIFTELGRGITQLRGTGAYTDEDVSVLYVVLSKYEAELLRAIVKRYDSNAFFIVKENIKIFGNYKRKI